MMNFTFLLNTLLHKRTSSRSSHKRCSVRKGVLRNFAKFTGKYLCQSLYFNKVAGLSYGLFKQKVSTFSKG